LYQSIVACREYSRKHSQPTMIVTDSTKGKGVSFMENQAGWHGKAPNTEQYEAAVAELQPETYFARLHTRSLKGEH
jgi:transketolase